MLLLLDLDNTLVDRELAFRAWAADFVAEIGGNSSDEEWLIVADANGYTPRETLAENIRSRFELAAPVVALVDRLLFDHVAAVACYPGVVDKLEEFRCAGDRLVIVTNGTTAQQTMKLRRAGLSDLVDDVIISESVGMRKPEPTIFRHAMRDHTDNTAVWMVGDNADADIRGAQKVGLLTGWVSHNLRWDGVESPTVSQPTTALVLEKILHG